MLLENIQRARIRSSQRQQRVLLSQQQQQQDDDDEEAEEAALASSASLDEGDFCAQLQAGRANRLVSAKIRRQLQKQQQQHRGRQGSGDSRQQFEEGKILLIASDNVLAFAEHMASIAGLEDLLCAYPIASTLYAGNKIDASAATEGAIARIQSVRGCTYIHTPYTLIPCRPSDLRRKQVPVYHCQHSYGCVFEFRSGHKLVYSGDCR